MSWNQAVRSLVENTRCVARLARDCGMGRSVDGTPSEFKIVVNGVIQGRRCAPTLRYVTEALRANHLAGCRGVGCESQINEASDESPVRATAALNTAWTVPAPLEGTVSRPSLSPPLQPGRLNRSRVSRPLFGRPKTRSRDSEPVFRRPETRPRDSEPIFRRPESRPRDSEPVFR